MAKYAYPAIFRKEEDGYAVEFPDISGCATCGATLPEAAAMAEDALCLYLFDCEEDGDTIPQPSDIKAIQAQTSDIASLICCDTLEYRKLYNNKAVKKTLTIPAWLNTLAERQGINFSTVLQNALKDQLSIQ